MILSDQELIWMVNWGKQGVEALIFILNSQNKKKVYK